MIDSLWEAVNEKPSENVEQTKSKPSARHPPSVRLDGPHFGEAVGHLDARHPPSLQANSQTDARHPPSLGTQFEQTKSKPSASTRPSVHRDARHPPSVGIKRPGCEAGKRAALLAPSLGHGLRHYCRQCGHYWLSEVATKYCPKCNSQHWRTRNTSRKDLSGTLPSEDRKNITCPTCHYYTRADLCPNCGCSWV